MIALFGANRAALRLRKETDKVEVKAGLRNEVREISLWEWYQVEILTVLFCIGIILLACSI